MSQCISRLPAASLKATDDLYAVGQPDIPLRMRSSPEPRNTTPWEESRNQSSTEAVHQVIRMEGREDKAQPASMEPDLRRLRSFVAVAQDLSYRKAAVRVGMDQGAMSRHVQDLERLFGVRLLERDRRGVALTSAGAVLLEEAQEVLACLRALRDRVVASETDQSA